MAKIGRPKGSKNKPKPAPDDDAATSTGKSDEEGELGDPHHAQRLSAIEEIAEQNIADREADQGVSLVVNEETNTIEQVEKKAEDEGETTGEEPKETEGEESPPAGEETAAEIEAAEKKAAETTKTKFVIDGVEKEYTKEEIAAIVQKSGAADLRLKEATELLQGAKQTTQQTTQATEAQPPASSSSDADAVDRDTLAKELTNAIVYGDEEQVAEAVTKLLGTGRDDVTTQVQSMTPEQVQGYVVETIAFNEGKRLLDLPPDKGGYSDLWLDPVLKAEFTRRENELRDAKDPRSYVELYTFIGDEVRTWRDELISKFTPKTGLEDRTDAKRKTGIVRGTGVTKTVPGESKPLSAQEKHEETLKQAATARGQ